MVCDQNKGGRQCQSALPGKQMLKESQLESTKAKKKKKGKKSATKITQPREALLLPLASLNIGDMGTAIRRGCFFAKRAQAHTLDGLRVTRGKHHLQPPMDILFLRPLTFFPPNFSTISSLRTLCH